MLTALGHTDVERWTNPSSYDLIWSDERTAIIARLVRPGASVLDLGAGAQTLRGQLPEGCEYQPADLGDGQPGVLSCDLNAGIYPAITKRYDYVVCSGLVEFLRAPRELFARAPQLADVMLLSYWVTENDPSRLQRIKRGYMSHLSRNELEFMFSTFGYRWTFEAEWQGQRIYRVDLRTTPAPATT